MAKNLLREAYPHLADEWHPDNQKSFDEVARASSYKAKWVCKICSYVWETAVGERGRAHRRPSGCPACSNQVVTDKNSLATCSPHLAKEWHPTLNHLSSQQVVNGSGKKVWWKCSTCTYEWKVAINERTRNRRQSSGCPSCAKRLLTPFNSLAVLFPETAKDWDEKRNGMDANQVVAGGKKLCYWKCHTCDYNWASPLYVRTRNIRTRNNLGGCPACKGKVVTDNNCLAVIHPQIAKELLAERSKFKASDITPGSRKLAWWKCHTCKCIWQAAIRTRSAGYGCPSCGTHGWNLWKLQVYLRGNWEEIRLLSTLEKCRILLSQGILLSTSPVRSVIEALLQGEIDQEQLDLFCGGYPSQVNKIAKQHQSVLYKGRSRIPSKLRERIYQRDNYQCLHCYSFDNLSIDHIWPHSKGGLDIYENLQTLCRSCNSSKNDNLIAESNQNYAIDMEQTPLSNAYVQFLNENISRSQK